MKYTKLALQYLASYISYSFQDDYDIKSRIAAATKATKFWYNPRHFARMSRIVE
jgi:hypothetical protein